MPDSEKIVVKKESPRFYSPLAEVYYDQAVRCHENKCSLACIAMCWAAVDYAVEHELRGGKKLNMETWLPRQAVKYNPRDIPGKLNKLWLLFPVLRKWEVDLLLLYDCFRNTFLHGKLQNLKERVIEGTPGTLYAITLESKGKELPVAYTAQIFSALSDMEKTDDSIEKETILIGAAPNIAQEAVKIMEGFLKELGEEVSRTNIPTKDEMNQKILTEWNNWLGAIYTDLQQTLVNRYIFKEVMGVVEANASIQIDDTFYGWMRMVYSQSAVVAVRRQADKRQDVVSFARLLEEIKKSPEIISRERYVALYVDSNLSEDIAHQAFDKYSGSGQTCISANMVNNDLKKLTELTNSVIRYSHKRVVHYDQKEFKNIPTWKALDDCLDFLEELVKKYLEIFRAEGHLHIVPVWQYNWKKIFTKPWINQK